MVTWAERFASDASLLLKKAPRRILPSYVPLHVAALYSGHTLIAAASNLYERHAEINCMRAVQPSKVKRHKPLRLIVSKLSGTHRMSRPCRACCREIKRRLPAARVFYTDHKGRLQEDVTLDNRHVNAAEKKRKRHQST